MRSESNFLKSNYRVLLTALIIFCCLIVCLPLMARAGTTNINLEVGIGTNTSAQGISYYIGMVYRFAAAIVGVVAVIMIIIGGIQYSTSAGNNALLGSAKETITSAIIGLVIVLMSYLILGIFSSKFTNLSEPDLEPISVNNTTGTGLPGNRLPESEWCLPGEKAYTDEQACNTACRRDYNQACTPRTRSDNQQKVYCCQQTRASNGCDNICEEEGRFCYTTIPCREVFTYDECIVLCGGADNCMVDNMAYYDEEKCTALYDRMRQRCQTGDQGRACGAPAASHKNGVRVVCCTQP